MLRIGRYNNVVQWREDMQNEACGLYGMTSTFVTTVTSRRKRRGKSIDEKDWSIRGRSRRYTSNFCNAAQTS